MEALRHLRAVGAPPHLRVVGVGIAAVGPALVMPGKFQGRG